MTTRTTIQSRMNKGIGKVLGVNQYFNEAPLDEIFNAVNANNALVVDEAGEAWSGILCGIDGESLMEVKMNDGSKSMWLRITWHKMEHSGRYEVIAYVS